MIIGRRSPFAAARSPFRALRRGVRPRTPQALNVLAEAQSTPNGLCADGRAEDVGRRGNELPDGLPFARNAGDHPCQVAHSERRPYYAAPLLGTDATGRFAVEDSTFGVPTSHGGRRHWMCRGERCTFSCRPARFPRAGGAWGHEEGERVWGTRRHGRQLRPRRHRPRRDPGLSRLPHEQRHAS